MPLNIFDSANMEFRAFQNNVAPMCVAFRHEPQSQLGCFLGDFGVSWLHFDNPGLLLYDISVVPVFLALMILISADLNQSFCRLDVTRKPYCGIFVSERLPALLKSHLRLSAQTKVLGLKRNILSFLTTQQ